MDDQQPVPCVLCGQPRQLRRRPMGGVGTSRPSRPIVTIERLVCVNEECLICDKVVDHTTTHQPPQRTQIP